MEPEVKSQADVWEWELYDEGLDRPGAPVAAISYGGPGSPVVMRSVAWDQD